MKAGFSFSTPLSTSLSQTAWASAAESHEASAIGQRELESEKEGREGHRRERGVAGRGESEAGGWRS
eukprot:scaffold69802_cov13-Tisochrysis_lutea.AAC.1